MTLERDEDRLLDHETDGIQEYDNPMPRWWLGLFYVTIAFSVLYFLNVPGIGIGKGRIANYEAEMAAARAAQEVLAAKSAGAPITDATLLAASRDVAILALGKTTFVNRCSPCHRPDGGGNIGPNLTDPYWIHGGRPSEIFHTVSTGVLDKGMPAWGTMLRPDEVRAAVAYVLTLRGTNPPNPKAPQGAQVSGTQADAASSAH